MRELNIVSKAFEYGWTSGQESLFVCPYPDCKSHKKEKKYKLSVNFKKNKYHCWVCGKYGKSVPKLLRAFGHHEESSELSEIYSEFVEGDFIDLFQEEITKPLKLPEGYQFILNRPEHPDFKTAIMYLEGRGISEEHIYRYKIGFCTHGKFKGRIIFPSFDAKGNLNYYVARLPFDCKWPYKDCDRNKISAVFNEYLIDWEDPLVLVEGIVDSKNIENCAVMLGSELYKNNLLFTRIVENKPKVLTAFDDDAYEKELKTAMSLMEFGVEVSKVPTKGFKDLGELSKKETEDVLDEVFELTEDFIFQETIKISLGMT